MYDNARSTASTGGAIVKTDNHRARRTVGTRGGGVFNNAILTNGKQAIAEWPVINGW